MTTPIDDWTGVLTAAQSAAGKTSDAQVLARAGDVLRLVWSTAGAVRADTADAELWWLRLVEAVAATADDLDLVPGAPAVVLGSGPRPTTYLPDTAAQRRSVGQLLATTEQGLRRYASQDLPGAETLAASLAWRSVYRAAAVARP